MMEDIDRTRVLFIGEVRLDANEEEVVALVGRASRRPE